MGLLGDIGNGISSVAGVFGIGGKANPNTYNLDDAAYEDYYNSALGDINNAYGAEDPQRAKINSSLSSMLGNLDNNAAGLKKNYEEDTSRSFGDAMQQRARSAGGTGNLAQALNPSGAALDAQARQTSRGYTDLYNTAVSQIGSLTNTEANLNDQSMQRGRDLAGLRMQRIGQRLGVATQSSANSRNADAIGQGRLYSTLSGGGKMLGQGAGGGGGGGAGGGIADQFAQSGAAGAGGAGAAAAFSDGGIVGDVAQLAPLAMMLLKDGGRVPGKPKIPGDHPENDTVPATLSPGEIVLPNSVTHGKSAPKKAAKFVERAKKKKAAEPDEDDYSAGAS